MNASAAGKAFVIVLVLAVLLAIGIYFSAKNTKNETLHLSQSNLVGYELAIHENHQPTI
ncbi:hypothetical protein IRY55_07840 [Savagea sp. SN6]|uniref:Uncharacterized protein n=1 Tax=Savagea serpentis TaxID=2785297 RepID=A0A8J7GBI4_9BACL|nr:hypothetical protein [Savagea serpentis]MBF4501270.1 hypothetical protein [Savagea serpentis]